MATYRIEAPDASLHLVSRSEEPVVSVAQMKVHLRVHADDHDDDDLIESIEQAVVQHIDGPDALLQRAIVDQTWDMKLSAFCSSIDIPLPPLISVDSVSYYDDDGALQVASSSLYQVVSGGHRGCGRIVLTSGSSWPTVYEREEPVIIRFRAGYMNVSESPAYPTVPAPIVAAIKMMAGSLYEHRETIVIGQTAVMVPWAAEALLAPYRVY
jgi:uncharacterized phiE125 gp8 family phage protein